MSSIRTHHHGDGDLVLLNDPVAQELLRSNIPVVQCPDLTLFNIDNVRSLDVQNRTLSDCAQHRHALSAIPFQCGRKNPGCVSHPPPSRMHPNATVPSKSIYSSGCRFVGDNQRVRKPIQERSQPFSKTLSGEGTHWNFRWARQFFLKANARTPCISFDRARSRSLWRRFAARTRCWPCLGLVTSLVKDAWSEELLYGLARPQL